MFVQVVRGVVAEPEAAFARLDQWLEDLAPGAPGWLGTTAGVTARRELVAFVRFATAADARANGDRLEQGQWWAGSVLLFTGDVSFDNYEDATVFGDGGSDAAGVVEVLRGRARHGTSAEELAGRLVQQAEERGRDQGLIGGLVGTRDDGSFTRASYYCRSALGRPLPPEPALDLPASGRSTELQLLRLDRLWFGSPERAGRATFSPRMHGSLHADGPAEPAAAG
jgi:hypothetical protein